jgi:hypothetical protein
MAELLEPLTRGAKATELVSETLSLLAQVLAEHPERLDSVCIALQDLSFQRLLPPKVDEWGGIAKFRLEDARLGVYDSIAEVAEDVTRALSPYLER